MARLTQDAAFYADCPPEDWDEPTDSKATVVTVAFSCGVILGVVVGALIGWVVA